MQVMPSVIYKQSQVAVKYLRKLMGAKIFDNPKDHEVLMRLIRYCTSAEGGDIILDFFAGSGSTAEAVLQLNREDNSDRRFVCVQLPETTQKQKKDGALAATPASKAGYKTIADIALERIRRVVARMEADASAQLALSTRAVPEDLGVRVWKLAPSNLKAWEEPQADASGEAYLAQMEMFSDPLLPGADPFAMVWEVALREGFALSSRVEKKLLARNEPASTCTVWHVRDEAAQQEFWMSLDDVLSLDDLRPLELAEGDTFICRAIALDDTLAANLSLQCRLKTL